MKNHRWYLLVTQSRAEKVVHETLREAGIESVLPLWRRTSQWKGRTKLLEWPLFPGYCFARLRDEQIQKALTCDHVMSFAGTGQPKPLDDATIEALQQIMTASSDYKAESHHVTGRTVRVISGPLRGINGELTWYDRQARLIIPVPIIQQAISVAICEDDVADIQPWTASVTSCVPRLWNAARGLLPKVRMTASSETRPSTADRPGSKGASLKDDPHTTGNTMGNSWRGYAIACVTVVCEFLLSFYLDPVQNRLTLFLLLFAVVGTTWHGGVKPGITALVLAAGCAAYGMIQSVNNSAMAAPQDMMRLLFFVVVSLSAIIFFEKRRTLLRELTHRTEALEGEAAERQHAERLCQELEVRYRRLFEENPLPTCVVDMKTLKYLAVNEAAIRHYGHSSQAFLSMTAKDIIPAEDVARFLKALNEMQTRPSGNLGVWHHRKRDGVAIDVEINWHQTSFQGRRAYLVVYQDVSDHVRVETIMQTLNDRLEQEVKEQTRCLREKQHQLRAIASQLTLAEDRERKRLAGVLHDNLSQLLIVSKMKLERISMQHSMEKSWTTLMNVKRLLDEAVTYSRTLIADLRPSLMGDEDDLKAALKWVADKMQPHGLMVSIRHYGVSHLLDEDVLIVTYQAVQELLWNVLKHAEVRETFVSTDSTADHVEITVQDYGRGFDASRRGQPSREGGFGLMNVCERLRTVGGHLQITAIPGHGTRAVLRVPMKGTAMSPACGTDEEISRRRPDHAATRILLVDDHDVTLQGLRDAIQDEPDMIVIGAARNAEMAMDLARKRCPDVIIMDIHLPDNSGVELTRALRLECPSAVVIGFSIEKTADMVHALRNAGAVGCLSKAEPLESLLTAIRTNATPAS